MNELIQDFKQDMGEFRKKTDQFYAKELSVKDYKGFSGGYGSYAQRGGNASMLRLRFACGQISKEQLAFTARMIRKHEVNTLHFTTCQTIQLHNLQREALYDIMETAMDYGIITRGGGGDFPRNVMTSPLTGISKDTYFDVTPYAKAVAQYLLGFIKTVKLPRKLKVGFTSGPLNDVHATFRDLGFQACPNGTFTVYSAGGLGPNARLGIKIEENVAPSDVLYYVKAMVDTFVAHGDYTNRAKSRSRFMPDSLGGAEGYIAAFKEKLALVREEASLTLDVTAPVLEKKGTPTTATHPRMHEQKQEGLYYVSWHPYGGTPEVSDFLALADAIESMPDVQLRLGPDETAYIINLTAEEAEKIIALTANSAATQIEASVSCVGNSICQIGLQNSPALLTSILEAVKPYQFADGVLPKIHISGCPSSCGTHQIGEIGFHGGMKLVDKKPTPAFQLFVNGSDKAGQERFGETIGLMAATDIPAFMVSLGQTIAEAKKTFATWYPNHTEEFKALAKPYL